MKWINASERLPDKPGRYFIKTDRQFVPDSNEVNQVAKFTAHKEWYLENHHHSNDFFWCNPYEWLDESQLFYTKEQLIEEIGRRQKLILSEPAGSVRETMIENLLIDLP